MIDLHRKSFPIGIALLAGALALCGCSEEIHSAQWYMAHGPELQDKLTECKKYPSLNESDQNCKAAGEAFATLVAASANAAPAEQAPPSDAH